MKHSDKSSSQFSAFVKSLDSIAILSREEERKTAIAAKKGDQKARELLVKSNMRYALKVARSYFKADIDNNDIIQEALAGLARAVKTNRFEPEKGFRFITFADPYIRTEIRKFLSASHPLSFSCDAAADLSRIKKALVTVAEESEEESSFEILSEKAARIANMNVKKARMLLRSGAACTSFEEPVSSSDGKPLEFGETICDESSSFVEEVAVNNEAVREIRSAMTSFSERDRKCFLLHAMYGASFSKIGAMTGLSREGVRLVCERTQHKLQERFA